MRLLVVAAIPPALIAVWAVWRAAVGRPVRRFALNAVVGVTLLGYFAITAGLGIFWVANQELPVFDPHYLFGYLTAALVVTHVVINWPLLVRFARRRSKALSADGQATRPTVAWAARAIGLALFGGACFWIGWSQGSTDVTVTTGDEVRPATAGARGLRESIVTTDDGARVPLWRWYLDRSRHSRRRVAGGGPALDWSKRPEPFETYPALAVVALPRDRAPVDRTTGAAIDAAAIATPSLGRAEVTLRRLSTLLHLVQGITSVTGLPGDPFHRRAAASSGALYPIVTHVVAADVDGLAPGLYHYEPRAHALHRLRDGDVRAELAAVVAHPHAVDRAPLAIVLSSIYYKSAWKYGERGYRYCLLDAGHVAANAIVAGEALGLATRMIARFDDERLAAVLGVDVARQGPVLVMPFGARDDADPARAPAFAPADLDLAGGDAPTTVLLAAGRTALRATGATAPRAEPAPPLRPLASGRATPLPAELSDGEPVGPVIERRRSQRRFGDAPLTATELATILRRALGASVEDQHATRVFVIASRVDGVPPGAYEYRPDDHALALVRDGDLSSEAHAAALSQEVALRAAAVLVLVADAPTMTWPDASRGLRYAWVDAGVAGGRVYLQAVALGVGVSSIGAFFDDDVADLLRLDIATHPPALLVALGR